MERWREILRRWGPRNDVDQEFYPDREVVEQPALLNSIGPMAAAFVGARILRAIVARGGSLVLPSAVDKLERLVARGLSDETLHHCEVEAERILEWINRRPVADEPGSQEVSGSSDFDVMINADLESRLSVARFALDEDYDLELEYFDEETSTWPRVRAQLLQIDESEGADFRTSIRLRDRDGEFDVSLKHVRWMMPVPLLSFQDSSSDGDGGDILEFPDS